MRMCEIRKSKHISQVKMALDLNISQNSISRYETGEREPDIQMLIKIADYLDVSLDYLLERTNKNTWNK
ncbi:MAG: helix-turn-helix transcriptional regulator [Clostridiales bacterium]|nr:helix-turn-helix transcriptional regulator [Clostridiales bacterium]